MRSRNKFLILRTTPPALKLITDKFFAFAELDRAMIIERTQEGKEAAKRREGNREGRPRSAEKDKARMDLAMEHLETESYNKAAEKTGISKSALLRETRRRKSWKGSFVRRDSFATAC